MLSDCYRHQDVLVTGMTGFKGAWLGTWLEMLGARVSGLALPPTPEMQSGWPGIQACLPCHEVDVRDAAAVMRLVRTVRPAAIFHLAAQPLVRSSYADPVGTLGTNVMGTAHVLEAARHTDSVRAVVVVTSDKCYENREWLWGYRETEAVGGHDPYSASKGCAELVAAAYRRSFAQDVGLQIASARAGNVIGGGDFAVDRIVPDIVGAVIQQRPIVLRQPMAVRPWQHVLEPLSGYLLLGQRMLDGDAGFDEAWNFGPPTDEVVTVGDLARGVIDAWGWGEVVERPDPNGPHEAHFLTLDSAKAAARLPWRTLLSTRERIEWTVKWYRSWHADPQSAWDRTREQISAYQDRIESCSRSTESSSPGSRDSSGPHSRRMIHGGVRVYGLDRPHVSSSRLDDLPAVELVDLPESTGDHLGQLLRRIRPDVVFHLAAAGVRAGADDQDTIYDSNVDLTVRLVTAATGCVGRCIYPGSCFEYAPRPAGTRIDESTPLAAFSFYGATKTASILLAQRLAQESGLAMITLRLFGVYGPGESSQRLIPYLVDRLLQNRSVDLTPGTQVRDLLYQDDVVSALVCAARTASLEPGGIWNVGSGQPVAIRDVGDRVAQLLAAPAELLQWGTREPRSEEPDWMVADPRKFQQDTGWQPQWTLDAGLEETIRQLRRQRECLPASVEQVAEPKKDRAVLVGNR